jgi:hypothetical protein
MLAGSGTSQPLGSPGGLSGGLGLNSGTNLSPQTNSKTAQDSKATDSDKKDSSAAADKSGSSSDSDSKEKALSFGGGAILGVASTSEKEGIKEFNGKSKYKDWYFVYDPAAEAANPKGGGLITGPYTGHTFSNGSTGIGTPASQLASPNQPSGFGQPIGTGVAGSFDTGSSSGSSAGSSPKQ